jgi:phage shock protein PspC (stress-responsive transcriptional regulator)
VRRCRRVFRLGWALFTLLGGSGLILYLIAAIIMPRMDRM